MMSKDGIALSMFEGKNLETGCAHGAYRKMIADPKDIKWDLIEFNDPDEDLLNPHYLIPGEKEVVTELKDSQDVHRALRIKFSLSSS